MRAPQPSSLRMTFWVCWAGTVLFFLVTPYAEIFFKAGFNPPGYLVRDHAGDGTRASPRPPA